jgi:hypothetical protein
MEETSSELRYDFPVVSDDGRDAGDRRLADARAGEYLLRDEMLYQAGKGRFDKEGVVGTLTLEQVRTTDEARVLVQATFSFDDGDEVVYRGRAPGNGSWNGRGTFAYVGGTGKFEYPRRNLTVDSENPKRWT